MAVRIKAPKSSLLQLSMATSLRKASHSNYRITNIDIELQNPAVVTQYIFRFKLIVSDKIECWVKIHPYTQFDSALI